jgi:hypothetical protein
MRAHEEMSRFSPMAVVFDYAEADPDKIRWKNYKPFTPINGPTLPDEDYITSSGGFHFPVFLSCSIENRKDR